MKYLGLGSPTNTKSNHFNWFWLIITQQPYLRYFSWFFLSTKQPHFWPDESQRWRRLMRFAAIIPIMIRHRHGEPSIFSLNHQKSAFTTVESFLVEILPIIFQLLLIDNIVAIISGWLDLAIKEFGDTISWHIWLIFGKKDSSKTTHTLTKNYF